MPDPRDQARYILHKNDNTKYQYIQFLSVNLKSVVVTVFMYLTKDTYNLKIILSMLDIALSEMVENECCSYCLNKFDMVSSICDNVDLCKSYLFEGLLQKVKERGD